MSKQHAGSGHVLTCLYCGRQGDRRRGKGDHVPPKAIGHWMVYGGVCGGCDSVLGHDVDGPLIAALGVKRLDSGLIREGRQRAEVDGVPVDFRVFAGGTAHPASRVRISSEGRVEDGCLAERYILAGRDGGLRDLREIMDAQARQHPGAMLHADVRITRHEQTISYHPPGCYPSLVARGLARIGLESLACHVAPLALQSDPAFEPIREYIRYDDTRPEHARLESWTPDGKDAEVYFDRAPVVRLLADSPGAWVDPGWATHTCVIVRSASGDLHALVSLFGGVVESNVVLARDPALALDDFAVGVVLGSGEPKRRTMDGDAEVVAALRSGRRPLSDWCLPDGPVPNGPPGQSPPRRERE